MNRSTRDTLPAPVSSEAERSMDDAVDAWLRGQWPKDESGVRRISMKPGLRTSVADAIEAAACGLWRGLVALAEVVRG